MNMHDANHAIIELIVEQKFATSFDDIYTMHVYSSNNDSNKFIVDVAFELRTHEMHNVEYDDVIETYELIQNYDMRIEFDLSNELFDRNEICNTIDYVKFNVVHCNAYHTREYEM
jgi:hypothetical protein